MSLSDILTVNLPNGPTGAAEPWKRFSVDALELFNQPAFQTLTSSTYTSTGVLAAADIFGGNIDLNPSSGQTFTLPTGAAMEAVITAAFGIAVPIGMTFWVTLANRSANTYIVAGEGGATFTVVNATISQAAHSCLSFKFRKSGAGLYQLLL